MEQQENYEACFALLDKIGNNLDALTELAHQKTAAVMRDDLMAVNECMRKEQALSLSLRSLDKTRVELLTGLGMENVPLSRMAEHCPEEVHLQAKAAAERLENRFRLYRAASDVCRTTLECNLHQIEKYLQQDAIRAAQQPAHRADFRA